MAHYTFSIEVLFPREMLAERKKKKQLMALEISQLLPSKRLACGLATVNCVTSWIVDIYANFPLYFEVYKKICISLTKQWALLPAND